MAKRTKQMKVIVAGMPRTSTISITSALRFLGYTPYDYFTRLELDHLSQWNRMLAAKNNGSREPLDKDHLDRLTGDYDVISDAPCFFLVEELSRAFPDAKILLNERDVASWLASISKTLQPNFEADQQWKWRLTRILDPTFTRPIMVTDELAAAVLCDYDYSDKAKLMERYARHYDSISHLDKSRTLRYRVQEGWKPLCQFLDLPVPDQPFPRENDANHLQDLCKLSAKQSLKNSVRNFLFAVLLVVITSMALLRLGGPQNSYRSH